MSWLSFLQSRYPSHELPFDLDEVIRVLKNQMKAGIIDKDGIVDYSRISLHAVLSRAGFHCQAHPTNKVGIGVQQTNPVVENKAIPDAAFEDDFDEFDFEETLKKDKIHVGHTFEDNLELLSKYQKNHDRSSIAYADIFKVNQRLVMKIATRYWAISAQTCLTLDDLIGYGNEGLIKAIEKFDLNSGNAFSTYATLWIKQVILRRVADEAWTIRIPVHVQEKLNKLGSIESRQMRELGHLDMDAICREMEISELQYQQYHQWLYQFRSEVSLNKLVSAESGEGNTELGDLLAEDLSGGLSMPDNPEINALNRDTVMRLNKLINEVLTDREMLVIRMRFGLDEGTSQMTLEQVGQQFGVTRERIRQIENKAINKLKIHIERQGRDWYRFEEE